MKNVNHNIFKHSCMMIKKTYKNYLLLSVTIFLSFSIMLGYLIFTDSNIYNKYNELMGASPNIILSDNSASYETLLNINKMITQMDNLSDTHYYINKHTLATTSFGTNCDVNFIPSYVWGVFNHAMLNDCRGITRLKINNEWELSLGDNEAIVSENMYESLKQNTDGEIYINLVIQDDEGNAILKKYNVAGSYTSDVIESVNSENSTNSDPVFVSIKSVDEADININNISLVIYTEKVGIVTELLQKYDLACVNVEQEQNNAVIEQNNIIQNKYIISAVLFILLGINLYSSFTNTLNERKFEIGVKRAIGASGFNIMLQFAIEAFIVIFINILLSILFMVNIVVLYKYIQLEAFNNTYTIVMSSGSVILFFVFSFFLTLIFSIFFAYQSTQVEIIKYLKEE